MKTLVAGGTGLVGAWLMRRLIDRGADVIGTRLSRPAPFSPERFRRFDLTDEQACREATRGMDLVILAAAQTFGAKVMKEAPTALIQPNLKINAGLLEACRINGVERVLFVSSSTVYQEADHPIREDELDLNLPPHALYLGVGGMKRYIEQLAGFYRARYGMNVTIVRPTNLFGPYDKFDSERAHVLPALILRALRREDPFVVWGDGKAVRDFLYIEDFVDDLLALLERPVCPDPINLGCGTALTIADAARVILEVCGHRVAPRFDPSLPEAIPYRMLNLERARSILGERRRTPFAEGIRRTVEWCRQRPAAVAV
jgi:GDP-L-fucose synthase